MVGKEFGERNFGFDSLKYRLKRDMEEKGIVACADSRRSCSAAAGGAAYDREVGTMERQRNGMDPKSTDSCLLKTSFSNAA